MFEVLHKYYLLVFNLEDHSLVTWSSVTQIVSYCHMSQNTFCYDLFLSHLATDS